MRSVQSTSEKTEVCQYKVRTDDCDLYFGLFSKQHVRIYKEKGTVRKHVLEKLT